MSEKKTKKALKVEKCCVCDGYGSYDDGETCRWCRGVGEHSRIIEVPDESGRSDARSEAAQNTQSS